MAFRATRLVTAVVMAGALALGACTSSDKMMGGDKMSGDKMMKDDMKKSDTMMEKK